MINTATLGALMAARGDYGDFVLWLRGDYVEPADVTVQPSNASKYVGGTATYSITAIGTPPPTAQWQRKPSGGSFADIEGATSTTYTKTGLTLEDNGSEFRCIVTNSEGTDTSDAATLTVNPEIDYMEYSSDESAQETYLAGVE